MKIMQPAVYILANTIRGTLYIGVTSHLIQRIYQHKNHWVDGFSKRYHTDLLVWYELHDNMESAIRREKQLKNWRRMWKIELIETHNPQWRDLWTDIIA